MKYLKENEVIYNKPTKKRNSCYISKRDRETVFSPIDQTPVINCPSKPVSTPQGLQDNLSTISNGIDTLDKFIDATLFNLQPKINNRKKI